MSAFNGWEASLLRSLGAPVTKENLKFLRAWHQAEGGTASYNPLNTTQSWKGASNYNDVGVKHYPSAQAGLLATKKTLLNGYYNNVVRMLKSGKYSASQIASQTGELSKWGTGEGVLRVLGSGKVKVPTATSAPVSAPISKAAPDVAQAAQAWKQQFASYLMGSAQSLAHGQAPDMSGLLQLAQMRQAIGAAQGIDAANNTPVQVEHNNVVSPNAPGIINLAKKYLGTKYVWGGESPKTGFDCSGFVQWLYGQQGVKIGRTTYQQWDEAKKNGQVVKRKQLRPGDIIFFAKGGDVHHEGMYIGHGQFIHSPRTGDVIKISSLSDPYYNSQFIGGRRVR